MVLKLINSLLHYELHIDHTKILYVILNNEKRIIEYYNDNEDGFLIQELFNTDKEYESRLEVLRELGLLLE